MSYNITSLKIKDLELRVPISEFLPPTNGKIETSVIRVKPENNYVSFKITFGDYGEDDVIRGRAIKIPTNAKSLDDLLIDIIDIETASYTRDYPMNERLEDLCKKYEGSVKMTTVWEGGDSINRIEIKDGKVIKEEEL